MRESGSFASLSPTLLARKGRARPAMRPQLQPLAAFRELVPGDEWQNDLGWNDMGEGEPSDPADGAGIGGEVVAFHPSTASSPVVAEDMPEVVRQQAEIAGRITAASSRSRRSALAEGRRAAFTLRLDAERHLALRLACTVGNRSAQAVVTEALDRLIADMPALAELADAVRKTR